MCNQHHHTGHVIGWSIHGARANGGGFVLKSSPPTYPVLYPKTAGAGCYMTERAPLYQQPGHRSILSAIFCFPLGMFISFLNRTSPSRFFSSSFFLVSVLRHTNVIRDLVYLEIIPLTLSIPTHLGEGEMCNTAGAFCADLGNVHVPPVLNMFVF